MEVPKPRIVQQTWGNSIAQAIQRERMMQHEKKIMDQELEYKKARDLVNDQKWNKEFDIRESAAESQTDIMKAQAERMGKQNEMLSMQVDQLINQAKQTEAMGDVVSWKAKDRTAQKEWEDKFALLKQKASGWGEDSEEAHKEMLKLKEEAGLGGADPSMGYNVARAGLMAMGPAGAIGSLAMGNDPTRQYFDWMFGSTSDIDNEMLARGSKEAQSDYIPRSQVVGNLVNNLGGSMTPQTYKMLMNEDFYEANAASGMSNQQGINYLQQMYQNQQPVGSPATTYGAGQRFMGM